jgi:hypothetical protein
MIEIHIERARKSTVAGGCRRYSASAVERSNETLLDHHPFTSASTFESAL